MKNKFLVESENKNWITLLKELLDKKINETLQHNHKCNIFLTGGRSAKVFYQNWLLGLGSILKKIDFYFGDERCLDANDLNKNSTMVEEIFKSLNISGYSLHSIHTEGGNFKESAKIYGENSAQELDIILLSLGDDGHVASLFPNSEGLKAIDSGYVYTQGPAPYKDRISITVPMINQFRCKIVLVIGKAKGIAFKNTYKPSSQATDYPLLLLKDLIFIFDKDAYDEIGSQNLT